MIEIKQDSCRMDREALAWATRLDGGALAATEQEQLDGWLAQSPSHAWRLAHFRAFYGRMHAEVPVALASKRDERAPRRRRHGLAAGLAAAAAVAIAAIWLATRPQQLATEVAQRSTITLDDGSRVELNARTHLAVALRASKRAVTLDAGEAFFSVAPDSDRPFVIETPVGRVRVTGTQFNVRLSGPRSLEVTVIEGAVEVQAGTSSVALRRNDQLSILPDSSQTRVLAHGAANDAVSWRDGKVVFNDTPLEEAFARFAPYHREAVRVDSRVANLTLGGRYTLDDFNDFVRSVERALPVKVLRGEGQLRVIPR
jgi:transmembrane sensor